MKDIKTAYLQSMVSHFFCVALVANILAIQAMEQEVNQEMSQPIARQKWHEQEELERMQVSARLELAKMLESGHGGEQDCDAARLRYEQVIEQSVDRIKRAEALAGLANLYFSHEFVKKVDFRNSTKAFHYYNLAAQQNDCLKTKMIAFLRLSQMYRWGVGTQEDAKKSYEYSKLVEDQTHCLWAQAEAWRMLGDIYYFGIGGIAKNREEALAYFQKAAHQEHSHWARAESWMRLGDFYNWGLGGLKQDYTVSRAYYESAANQTYSMWAQAEAHRRLGDFYDWAHGVAQDHAKAHEYFLKAANQDYSKWAQAEAWRKLGDHYLFGNGVTKDYEKAIEYFNKAIDAKQYSMWAYAESCRRLGEMYMGHYGVAPDDDKAVSLLQAAIEQKSSPWAKYEAHYFMGELLAKLKKYDEAEIHLENCLDGQCSSAWARAKALVALSKMDIEGVFGEKNTKCARIYLSEAAQQTASKTAKNDAERMLKELNEHAEESMM